LSSRLSEAPNANHTPLQGIAIKAQRAAIKKTLERFQLDQPQRLHMVLVSMSAQTTHANI
jgi:hypothetical protein